MKHLITSCLFASLALSAHAQTRMRAQDPMAGLSRAGRVALHEQAQSFFSASADATKKAGHSTVSVSYRGTRLAFGTAVSADGYIVTKWSEIERARQNLTITTSDGKQHSAQIKGVYPKYDLAILSSNATTIPVDFTTAKAPRLGSFLALARPDGKVEGFGVVSVKHRSLREEDKAYLGVMMDFAGASDKGVPLRQVMGKSAADRAGLKGGDIITSVDGKVISGAMQMRNLLQRLRPGSDIKVKYNRAGKSQETTVYLGSRADANDDRRVPRQRMERMQRMGTEQNRVRDNFPSVIQSDMALEKNDVGAPVTDLDGNLVGIVIARASRIKTYIIPAADIAKALASKAQPANTPLARARAPRTSMPRGRNPQPAAGDTEPMGEVRRRLSEIERNNAENEENLDKIRKALEKMEQKGNR